MNNLILVMYLVATGILVSCAGTGSDTNSANTDAPPTHLAGNNRPDETGSPTCKNFDESVSSKCAPSNACKQEKTDACSDGCAKYCPASQPPSIDSTGTPSCNSFDNSVKAACAPTPACLAEQKKACQSYCLAYCTQ